MRVHFAVPPNIPRLYITTNDADKNKQRNCLIYDNTLTDTRSLLAKIVKCYIFREYVTKYFTKCNILKTPKNTYKIWIVQKIATQIDIPPKIVGIIPPPPLTVKKNK